MNFISRFLKKDTIFLGKIFRVNGIEDIYYNIIKQTLNYKYHTGDVILDLKKATKTNNIKITLEGIVEIGGRSISLFAKSALIAESPEGDQKSYYLEPHTHRFPFRMTIPSSKDYKVPSTLEVRHHLNAC
jgi:hypothetical protein